METNELNSNFILEQYNTLQCSMICDIIPFCLILGIGYRVLINTSTLLDIFLQLASWVMYKLTNFFVNNNVIFDFLYRVPDLKLVVMASKDHQRTFR